MNCDFITVEKIKDDWIVFESGAEVAAVPV